MREVAVVILPTTVQRSGPGVPGDRLRRVRERLDDLGAALLRLLQIPLALLALALVVAWPFIRLGEWLSSDWFRSRKGVMR
jgi:hypothetical protein